MVLRRETYDSLGSGSYGPVAYFWWLARTTANLVPCTVRGPLGVELLSESGRRLDVQGNGRTVTSVAELPEAMTAAHGARQDRAPAEWTQLVRLRGARPGCAGSARPARGTAFPVTAPRCVDRSKPSRLMRGPHPALARRAWPARPVGSGRDRTSGGAAGAGVAGAGQAGQGRRGRALPHQGPGAGQAVRAGAAGPAARLGRGASSRTGCWPTRWPGTCRPTGWSPGSARSAGARWR